MENNLREQPDTVLELDIALTIPIPQSPPNELNLALPDSDDEYALAENKNSNSDISQLYDSISDDSDDSTTTEEDNFSAAFYEELYKYSENEPSQDVEDDNEASQDVKVANDDDLENDETSIKDEIPDIDRNPIQDEILKHDEEIENDGLPKDDDHPELEQSENSENGEQLTKSESEKDEIPETDGVCKDDEQFEQTEDKKYFKEADILETDESKRGEIPKTDGVCKDGEQLQQADGKRHLKEGDKLKTGEAEKDEIPETDSIYNDDEQLEQTENRTHFKESDPKRDEKSETNDVCTDDKQIEQTKDKSHFKEGDKHETGESKREEISETGGVCKDDEQHVRTEDKTHFKKGYKLATGEPGKVEKGYEPTTSVKSAQPKDKGDNNNPKKKHIEVEPQPSTSHGEPTLRHNADPFTPIGKRLLDEIMKILPDFPYRLLDTILDDRRRRNTQDDDESNSFSLPSPTSSIRIQTSNVRSNVKVDVLGKPRFRPISRNNNRARRDSTAPYQNSQANYIDDPQTNYMVNYVHDPNNYINDPQQIHQIPPIEYVQPNQAPQIEYENNYNLMSYDPNVQYQYAITNVLQYTGTPNIDNPPGYQQDEISDTFYQLPENILQPSDPNIVYQYHYMPEGFDAYYPCMDNVDPIYIPQPDYKQPRPLVGPCNYQNYSGGDYQPIMAPNYSQDLEPQVNMEPNYSQDNRPVSSEQMRPNVSSRNRDQQSPRLQSRSPRPQSRSPLRARIIPGAKPYFVPHSPRVSPRESRSRQRSNSKRSVTPPRPYWATKIRLPTVPYRPFWYPRRRSPDPLMKPQWNHHNPAMLPIYKTMQHNGLGMVLLPKSSHELTNEIISPVPTPSGSPRVSPRNRSPKNSPRDEPPEVSSRNEPSEISTRNEPPEDSSRNNVPEVPPPNRSLQVSPRNGPPRVSNSKRPPGELNPNRPPRVSLPKRSPRVSPPLSSRQILPRVPSRVVPSRENRKIVSELERDNWRNVRPNVNPIIRNPRQCRIERLQHNVSYGRDLRYRHLLDDDEVYLLENLSSKRNVSGVQALDLEEFLLVANISVVHHVEHRSDTDLTTFTSRSEVSRLLSKKVQQETYDLHSLEKTSSVIKKSQAVKSVAVSTDTLDTRTIKTQTDVLDVKIPFKTIIPSKFKIRKPFKSSLKTINSNTSYKKSVTFSVQSSLSSPKGKKYIKFFESVQVSTTDLDTKFDRTMKQNYDETITLSSPFKVFNKPATELKSPRLVSIENIPSTSKYSHNGETLRIQFDTTTPKHPESVGHTSKQLYIDCETPCQRIPSVELVAPKKVDKFVPLKRNIPIQNFSDCEIPSEKSNNEPIPSTSGYQAPARFRGSKEVLRAPKSQRLVSILKRIPSTESIPCCETLNMDETPNTTPLQRIPGAEPTAPKLRKAVRMITNVVSLPIMETLPKSSIPIYMDPIEDLSPSPEYTTPVLQDIPRVVANAPRPHRVAILDGPPISDILIYDTPASSRCESSLLIEDLSQSADYTTPVLLTMPEVEANAPKQQRVAKLEGPSISSILNYDTPASSRHDPSIRIEDVSLSEEYTTPVLQKNTEVGSKTPKQKRKGRLDCPSVSAKLTYDTPGPSKTAVFQPNSEDVIPSKEETNPPGITCEIKDGTPSTSTEKIPESSSDPQPSTSGNHATSPSKYESFSWADDCESLEIQPGTGRWQDPEEAVKQTRKPEDPKKDDVLMAPRRKRGSPGEQSHMSYAQALADTSKKFTSEPSSFRNRQSSEPDYRRLTILELTLNQRLQPNSLQKHFEIYMNRGMHVKSIGRDVILLIFREPCDANEVLHKRCDLGSVVTMEFATQRSREAATRYRIGLRRKQTRTGRRFFSGYE